MCHLGMALLVCGGGRLQIALVMVATNHRIAAAMANAASSNNNAKFPQHFRTRLYIHEASWPYWGPSIQSLHESPGYAVAIQSESVPCSCL